MKAICIGWYNDKYNTYHESVLIISAIIHNKYYRIYNMRLLKPIDWYNENIIPTVSDEYCIMSIIVCLFIYSLHRHVGFFVCCCKWKSWNKVQKLMTIKTSKPPHHMKYLYYTIGTLDIVLLIRIISILEALAHVQWRNNTALLISLEGYIRGTVVSRWIAGQ